MDACVNDLFRKGNSYGNFLLPGNKLSRIIHFSVFTLELLCKAVALGFMLLTGFPLVVSLLGFKPGGTEAHSIAAEVMASIGSVPAGKRSRN